MCRFISEILAAAVVAGAAMVISTADLSSAQAADLTDEASIARGGKLYDKWYKVIGKPAPKASHKLYPTDKKYAKKAKSNWRCKECHGWDYRGKDGAYAKGKHHSGIVGINRMSGGDPSKVIAVLSSARHGFANKLSAGDMADLANFVTKGQIDMDRYIDRATKKPKGDPSKGAVYYQTICAGCHGLSGHEPKDMKSFAKQMGNPWEVMHKILNGQPREQMPALRALDHQIIADIMAHMATLP